MHIKLSVNGSKTEVMLVKTQNNYKLWIAYNNGTLEIVESLKYNGFKVPFNHRWNEFILHSSATRKGGYYVFKNLCNEK